MLKLRRFFQKKLRQISDYNTLLRTLFVRNCGFTEMPEMFDAFDSVSNVAVMAPHPDDEAIGSGGFLLRLKQQNPNAVIKLIYLTDGIAAGGNVSKDLSAIRKKEAVRFAKKIEVNQKDMIFMDYQDRNLRATQKASDELKLILEEFRPTHLLMPYPADLHNDHFEAAQLAAKALKLYNRKVECWCYEVWTPLIPNRLVDITAVIKDKEQGIQVFESQQGENDYAEKIKALNLYRSILASGKARYAEAFFVCSESDFMRLTEHFKNRGERLINPEA